MFMYVNVHFSSPVTYHVFFFGQTRHHCYLPTTPILQINCFWKSNSSSFYINMKEKKKMEKSKIKLFLQFFKNLNSTAVRNKFKKPIQRNSKPMQRNSFNTVTNIRVLASFRGTYATRPSLQAKKKS